ncbi:MAG TPA: hypothetical protein VHT92_11295 [Candidatus Cybelea sp.]|jgi:hypothetical protein|nr:hypothetical protein [Candidatus Cybelea sp.]
MFRLALRICAALVLAACGAAQIPRNSPALSQQARTAPQTTGNIYWSKRRLDLGSAPSKGGRAVLTYWGPDGYYTYPVYCKNGGNVSATPHRTWGNPKKYLHVIFWFKAQTPGPDRCAFEAVLANTGSPPFAIIKLKISGQSK